MNRRSGLNTRPRELLAGAVSDQIDVRRICTIALAALACSGVFAGTPAGAAAGQAKLGVYRGGGNSGGVHEFEVWLGRPVDVALDFLAQSTWNEIAAPTWWASRWGATPYRVVYSVPMLPDSGGTLQQGAGGAYNSYFRQLAQTLLANGEGDSIVRIGWEFNGSWMRWNAQADPAAFVGYWRQIVETMRSVTGTRFAFDWSPNRGRGSVAPDLAYPGDSYVDYVGMDSYDTGWAEGWQDPVRRWQTMLTEPYGLEWHRRFAAEHGKQMSYPEWGLWIRDDGHGGGDDPYYIEKMRAWIDANDVAYHSYFEYDAPDGQHRLMTGQFPLGAAAFRAAFGPGAASPPPPPPPLPPGASSPLVAAPDVPSVRDRKPLPALRRRVRRLARIALARWAGLLAVR